MTRSFVRDLPHLVRRFFGHVTADALHPAEQAVVRESLDDEALAALFFDQAAGDQRHAYEVAQRFRDVRPGDELGFRAALLHDVGKRHAQVSAVGRSLATVFDSIGLPLPESWRSYRNHGPLGAEDLAAAGADLLTVAFARHHSGSPPENVDPVAWRALLDADDV